MNRILIAVDRMQAQIAAQNLTTEKIESISEAMNMSLREYVRFQELKTLAVGSKLTLEEANTVYGFLGNTVEHFNTQPLAVKVTLTKLFAELLRK